jgi:hypothetical protein
MRLCRHGWPNDTITPSAKPSVFGCGKATRYRPVANRSSPTDDLGKRVVAAKPIDGRSAATVILLRAKLVQPAVDRIMPRAIRHDVPKQQSWPRRPIARKRYAPDRRG